MNALQKKPVLAVLGPTASGKTSLAIKIAKTFNCEIVNCDSRQIYREMRIGTARPDDTEMQQVPHHLFNLISPDQAFSAADYSEHACRVIKEIWQRNRIPLLTGGTGFYYAVVSEGLGEAGHNPELAEKLRVELETVGFESFVKKLLELDPEAGEMVDLKNPRRVLRAAEIVIGSKKPLSANRPVSPLPEAEFKAVVVTRPRSILHENIARRVDQMICEGLEKEVSELIDRYGRSASGLNSIGYNEWFDYFDGRISPEQVREQIIIHTRQYAKRQETWFRRRPGVPVSDLSIPENESEIFQQISAFINFFAL